MRLEENIKKKLVKSLNIEDIEVINNSHYHQGHKDSPNNNNSHFLIKIKSKTLSKENKLKIHRMIYSSLVEEMRIIHALEIKINE